MDQKPYYYSESAYYPVDLARNSVLPKSVMNTFKRHAEKTRACFIQIIFQENAKPIKRLQGGFTLYQMSNIGR